MQIQFNARGNQKQLEACKRWADNKTTEIVYGGAKSGGKSFLGVSLVFADALIYPNVHLFIARKELNDLRKYTIPSVHEVFDYWGLEQKYYKYNGQDNYFSLYNGSKVYFIAVPYLPSDPDFKRFGSMQMTRGFIEEAGEVHEAAKRNLQATIGRWKNKDYGLLRKLLMTCNPAKGFLYNEYYKPNKEGTLPPYKAFIQALPTDNKMNTAGYLENLQQVLSPNEKERLLYGNWEFDDDQSILLDYRDILNIFTNDFVPSGKMYLTTDIAMQGKDKFVVFVWEGFRVVEIYEEKKSDGKNVLEVIERIAKKWRIPQTNIAFDSDGLGSYLRGFLANALPFVANSSPLYVNGMKEKFGNFKSQCAFMMADKIRANEIFIKSNTEQKKMIIEELELWKDITYGTDAPKRLEPKELTKQKLGRSPDYSDNLIFRMIFELKGNKISLQSGKY